MDFRQNGSVYSVIRHGDGRRIPQVTDWVVPYPGEKHQWRFLGQPYQLWVATYGQLQLPFEHIPVNDNLFEVGTDVKGRQIATFKAQEFEQLGYTLRRVVIARILDRREVAYVSHLRKVSRFKLALCSSSLLDGIGALSRANNINPTGADGYDFHINTYYLSRHPLSLPLDCSLGLATPITAEENEYLTMQVDITHNFDLARLCTPEPANICAQLLRTTACKTATKTCPDCKGTKQYVGLFKTTPCPTCKGQGAV
jgi:hypothetical protein